MRLHGCVHHILFTKRNRNIIIFGTREVNSHRWAIIGHT